MEGLADKGGTGINNLQELHTTVGASSDCAIRRLYFILKVLNPNSLLYTDKSSVYCSSQDSGQKRSCENRSVESGTRAQRLQLWWAEEGIKIGNDQRWIGIALQNHCRYQMVHYYEFLSEWYALLIVRRAWAYDFFSVCLVNDPIIRI